jgi:predicted DNA-binding transcriptional regulator AlpA
VIADSTDVPLSPRNTRLEQTMSHAGQSAEIGTALAADTPVEQQTSPAWQPGDALLTISEIRQLFKLGRTAAYELTHRPDFPAPVCVSARCYRWWAGEVTAFAAAARRELPAQRRARRDDSPPPAVSLLLTGRPRPTRRRRSTR